jgi:hypothetical protein
MSRALLAALAAAAALAACTSDAERLVELRADLRTRLDALYELYGGGALAVGARTDAQRDGAGEAAATAARFLGEMDRSWFEGYCLAHGRGERPLNLSEKLEAFMKTPEHRDACRDAARLEVRVRALEARLARK